jgi:hypothetical protein
MEKVLDMGHLYLAYFPPGSKDISQSGFYKSRSKSKVIQNNEVHNVSNVIMIQNTNRKSIVEQHRPQTNANARSDAMEE